MALKGVVAGIGGVALFFASATLAAEYRPEEFLNLDLSRAVLSPNPLGPRTSFAPVGVEARTDRPGEPGWARDDLNIEPKKVAVQSVKASHPRHIATASSRKRVGAARTRLARRHAPLDAQAMDARIQAWPCKSGGICNWKQ